MNTKLLEYHMACHGDNKNDLAAALGIHVQTLYRKLRDKDFSLLDIRVIQKRYELTIDECWQIFLPK